MKKIYMATLMSVIFVSSFAQLSGTYTIGGTGYNYSTIASAVSALENNGINGPVTFLIRNGTYSRTYLDSVPGSSSVNTVLFESESGDSSTVIMSDNTNVTYPSVFTISGCNYITIQGITIRGIGTDYCRAVSIFGGSNNTIRNCVLEGDITSVIVPERKATLYLLGDGHTVVNN
ncbi:MAG: hypothetical protein KJ607_03255, partial [Bacteroidetes bacterium]|nr:hypothetical protein [Bacteroidota bacterium]